MPGCWRVRRGPGRWAGCRCRKRGRGVHGGNAPRGHGNSGTRPGRVPRSRGGSAGTWGRRDSAGESDGRSGGRRWCGRRRLCRYPRSRRRPAQWNCPARRHHPTRREQTRAIPPPCLGNPAGGSRSRRRRRGCPAKRACEIRVPRAGQPRPCATRSTICASNSPSWRWSAMCSCDPLALWAGDRSKSDGLRRGVHDQHVDLGST